MSPSPTDTPFEPDAGPTVMAPAAGRTSPGSLAGWFVVVPLKGADAAKSRLAPAGDDVRRALATAMAQDTVAAAVGCVGPGRVLVVTDDTQVGGWARRLGARPVRDPGTGLDDAVRAGQQAAWGLAADAGQPSPAVAALVGDLPCLTAADLRGVLRRAWEHERAFVPDAEGTGTVLLTARPGARLEPRFGPGSAARHALVAARLDAPAGVRTDVDDVAAWRRAVQLGAGPRTRDVAS